MYILKKHSFLLFIFLLLIACNKENENQEPDIFIYELESIIDYIPDIDFEQLSTSIFIDSNQNELVFDVNYSCEMVMAGFNDDPFETKEIKIIYSNLELENFSSFSVIASADSYQEVISEYLHATINSSLNNGFAASARINAESPELFAEYYEELNLLDKDFDEVFTNWDLLTPEGVTSYRKIYYNNEFGVIGFEDKYGKLWIFDRFE